jgi:hypothetical protein
VVQVKNDGVNKSILLIGKDEQKGGRDKQRYQEPEFCLVSARSWGCGTMCCHDMESFHQVLRFIFSSLAGKRRQVAGISEVLGSELSQEAG